MLALPVFGRIFAKELQERLAVELILGREVSVKSAAGQPCLGHDLLNRHFRKSFTVEQPSCAANNSLAGFLFALRRMRHRSSSYSRLQHYAPAKDVLEHLSPVATLRAHCEKSAGSRAVIRRRRNAEESDDEFVALDPDRCCRRRCRVVARLFHG